MKGNVLENDLNKEEILVISKIYLVFKENKNKFEKR